MWKSLLLCAGALNLFWPTWSSAASCDDPSWIAVDRGSVACVEQASTTPATMGLLDWISGNSAYTWARHPGNSQGDTTAMDVIGGSALAGDAGEVVAQAGDASSASPAPMSWVRSSANGDWEGQSYRLDSVAPFNQVLAVGGEVASLNGAFSTLIPVLIGLFAFVQRATRRVA